ncbi:MAG: RsiV family protein [Bacteroidaceae bacterium]|nr:RsiV family protein [Bacteroidaceae bacterium]
MYHYKRKQHGRGLTKLLVLVGLAATMLASCHEGRRSADNEGRDSTQAAQTETAVPLRFDTVGLHRNVAVMPPRQVPRYCIDMCLNFAQGDSPQASAFNECVCRSLFAVEGMSPEEAMTHYADSLANQFSQELRDFYEPDDEDGAYRFTYTWQMTGNLCDTPLPGIVGYEAKLETYQGGAHGSYQLSYLNFDEADGYLDKRSVFREETLPRLIEALTRQLLADNGCKTVDELIEQTSITMLGDIFVENNFLIRNDGIMFIYNQYEIAPYSAGLISIFLTYPQLRDFLRPEFVKRRLP